MENKLNLAELLKNIPKGTELYSPICGECKLMEALNIDSVTAIKVQTKDGDFWSFAKDGHYTKEGGECLLFPSKENRDWSTFKIKKENFQVGDYVKVNSSGKVYLIKQIKETGVLVSDIINTSLDFEFPIDKSIISEKVTKFDPKWLKPFDRVLAFDQIRKMWIATLFSNLTEEDENTYPYITCDADSYQKCIPFNAETKHLVGTSDEEPEFYRI